MDGCNEGSGDGQPMLYDSVPLASWSIPDLGSGQYDVIDDADVDALAEPRQVAPSRCRRFVDALCGLSGRLKPLTDDDERKAMQAASSRWHLAAHRRTVVVGAFTGVYCIRIQKDNLAASLKFHDLFKQKRMSITRLHSLCLKRRLSSNVQSRFCRGAVPHSFAFRLERGRHSLGLSLCWPMLRLRLLATAPPAE